MYNESFEWQCFYFKENDAAQSRRRNFVRILKTVCILILVPYSVRDYCKIESIILVSRHYKTRNRGAGISRKNLN